MVVKGIPSIDDVGSYKVVIKVRMVWLVLRLQSILLLMSMRRKIIFTISVVFIVISVCIYFFVFKASGSDSAVS